MIESIFSTYSTGENRVTSSILAVLRCLALPRIEAILGALVGDVDFELVRFENQPGQGGEGVPDGEIVSSCRILLETKRVRNDLKRDQLQRHINRLTSETEKVLVLTPDDHEPSLIAEMKDKRLVWNSFSALNQAIDDLLSDDKNDKEVISEREEFLLRELQKMLLAEKDLIGSSKDVLVIPARNAWPIYNSIHAYICQPGRPFRPVKYVAFYESNRIQPKVAKILSGPHDDVIFEPNKNNNVEVDDFVKKAIEISGDWPFKFRSRSKVFILSAPEAKETVTLPHPIPNDLTSKATGQRIAFTQNQRYVSLDAIKKAKTTKDLEKE